MLCLLFKMIQVNFHWMDIKQVKAMERIFFRNVSLGNDMQQLCNYMPRWWIRSDFHRNFLNDADGY